MPEHSVIQKTQYSVITYTENKSKKWIHVYV